MEKRITFQSLADPSKSSNISIETPCICPNCNKKVELSVLNGFYDATNNCYEPTYPFTILKCPFCQRTSFAIYESFEPDIEEETLSYIKQYPEPKSQKQFSAEISSRYSRFCEIYNESVIAEQENLLQICGMGYRKALEVLVKDYAIEKHPQDEKSIKSSFLGMCIKKYIDSEKIQKLAEASSWIGNDEAHYEKRNTDYSIKEMKLFINAVVSTIETDIAYEKACEFLSLSKP